MKASGVVIDLNEKTTMRRNTEFGTDVLVERICSMPIHQLKQIHITVPLNTRQVLKDKSLE